MEHNGKVRTNFSLQKFNIILLPAVEYLQVSNLHRHTLLHIELSYATVITFNEEKVSKIIIEHKNKRFL